MQQGRHRAALAAYPGFQRTKSRADVGVRYLVCTLGAPYLKLRPCPESTSAGRSRSS